jgi:hypothetical protein
MRLFKLLFSTALRPCETFGALLMLSMETTLDATALGSCGLTDDQIAWLMLGCTYISELEIHE